MPDEEHLFESAFLASPPVPWRGLAGSVATHLVLVPLLAFGFQEAVRKPVRRPLAVSPLTRYEVVTLRLPSELLKRQDMPNRVEMDERQEAPRRADLRPPVPAPAPAPAPTPVKSNVTPAPAPPPAPAPKAFTPPPERKVEVRAPGEIAAPPSLQTEAAKLSDIARPNIEMVKAPKPFTAPPERKVELKAPGEISAPPSLRTEVAKLSEIARPNIEMVKAPKPFTPPPAREAEKAEVVILQPPTVKTQVAKLSDMALPTITMVAPKPPKSTRVFDVGAMQRQRSMPKIQEPGQLPEPPPAVASTNAIRPGPSMAVDPKLPIHAAPPPMQSIPATGGKEVSAGGPVVASPANLVMSSTRPVPARETVEVPAVIVPPKGSGGSGIGTGDSASAARPAGAGTGLGTAAAGSAAGTGMVTGTPGGTGAGAGSATRPGAGGGAGVTAGAAAGGAGTGAGTGTVAGAGSGTRPGGTGTGSGGGGVVAGTGTGTGPGVPGGTPGGVGVRPPSVAPAGPVTGGGGTGRGAGGGAGTGGSGLVLAADGTVGIRVVHPSTGRHDVMVVHSGVEQILPEARGLLQGDPVYTVYLNVGWNREWIMHYCVPREGPAGAKQVGGVVSLGDAPPPPVRAPYPLTTVVPPQNQTPPAPPNLVGRKRAPMLFYGYLEAQGTLSGMKMKGTDETGFGAKVLKALESWDMRPATKGDAPTRVQVILLVPMVER